MKQQISIVERQVVCENGGKTSLHQISDLCISRPWVFLFFELQIQKNITFLRHQKLENQW